MLRLAILGVLATVTPLYAQVNEYFDYAQFQTAATSFAPLTIVDFDALSTGNGALAGSEFAGVGLTIEHRDGSDINVVSPGGDIGPIDFNSLPNGISAGFGSDGLPFPGLPENSDNFDFILRNNIKIAGLWVGNLGGSGNEDTEVQFLSTTNSVLASETLNRFHPNVVGGTGTFIFQNRLFYGVASDGPSISRIRVTNAAGNIDALVFDDVQFAAIPEPSPFLSMAFAFIAFACRKIMR